MTRRTRAREIALQALFQEDLNPNNSLENLGTFLAARLQDAQAGPEPIYLSQPHELGHGRGTPLRALVQRYARMYAFIDAALK